MRTFHRVFVWSAAIMLTMTALAKLVSATGSAAILYVPDPLLGLSNRQTLIVVGLVEIGAVAALLSCMRPERKCLIVMWLSSSFLLYRIAFHWIAPGKPCPCLGSLAGNLPISERTVGWALAAMTLYLLVGSVALFRARLRLDHCCSGSGAGGDEGCACCNR